MIIDPTTYMSSKVYKFYACYMLQNVHEVETDASYFTFKAADGGYLIGTNNQKTVSGKITLPVVTPENAYTQTGHNQILWGTGVGEDEKIPAGQPIVGIMPGTELEGGTAKNFSQNNEITHVFWKGGAEAATYIAAVPNYAFWNDSNLEYFEYPVNTTSIGTYAFANDYKISFGDGVNLSRTVLPEKLVTIEDYAFTGSFRRESDSGFALDKDEKILYFPGSLAKIGKAAFRQMLQINILQFGDSDNPSQLDISSLDNISEIEDRPFWQDIYDGSSGGTHEDDEIKKITIYSSVQFANNDEVIEAFGLIDNTNVEVEWPNANK